MYNEISAHKYACAVEKIMPVVIMLTQAEQAKYYARRSTNLMKINSP